MTRAHMVRALWLPAIGLACTRDVQLDAQINRVDQLLMEAAGGGALRCAPRQLAVARSELEFAQLERAHGYRSRAEQHLEIAERNARAAKLLSPAEHCRPPAAPAREDGAAEP